MPLCSASLALGSRSPPLHQPTFLFCGAAMWHEKLLRKPQKTIETIRCHGQKTTRVNQGFGPCFNAIFIIPVTAELAHAWMPACAGMAKGNQGGRGEGSTKISRQLGNKFVSFG